MTENRIKVEITSADLTGLLQELSNCGVAVFDLRQAGNLCVTCSVKEHDFHVLQDLAIRRSDSIRVIRQSVIRQAIRSVGRRSVLLIGMTILLALAIYLPTRVLFISVEGNVTIPTQLLMQKAEECGIRFGASRKLVRSEHVKNCLLNHIPQLQWVGVNTQGCVAIVSIEEKSPEQQLDGRKVVSNIVARQDGIITDITVRSGNPMCQVGQAVQAGQLLVSGYMDCGLKVQAVKSDADIMAQTIRKMDIIMPINSTRRVGKLRESKIFMLQIGKKLIKLHNGSGISDGSCVKMYSKKYVELPGGFHLPIALITVEYIYYSSGTTLMSHDQGSTLLLSDAHRELRNQMIAGRILQEDTVMISENGYYRLVGEYICTEMIGKTVHEESFYTHGKDH